MSRETDLADLITNELGLQIGQRMTIGQGALALAKVLIAHQDAVQHLAHKLCNTKPRGEPVLVDFEAYNQLDTALRRTK